MCNWNGSNVSFSCWSIAPLVSWWFCLKPRETRETISNAALFARWPNRNHHQHYIRLLSISKFITIFSFLLNGNGNLFQSPRKEKGPKKRRGKVWYFSIPEEVWIKSKGIVFSFLYFGSLFRVRFSLFQLGILNLHAIGSKPGNLLFYEHFVLWPVLAARVSPVSHFNRDSASWHLKTWFRNQNCWILYFTIKYISQWHFNCLVGKIDQHKIWV